MTLQQSIDQATELHRAGRLHEAERIYRRILSTNPNVPDVLQLLGIIMSQYGRHDAAADLIRKAIALNPRAAIYHGNLALALDKLDRLDEAALSFQTALDLGSADPNILTNFASNLRKRKQLEPAIRLARRALDLSPDFPDGRNNLGVALFDAGQIELAIEQYRIAIRLRPDFPEAHNNLGNALQKQKQFHLAIPEFERAISLRPDYFEAMMNLGVALQGLGETERAIRAHRRSLAVNPDFYEAHLNLGQALCDLRDFPGAIAEFRRAIALRPDGPDAHFHLSGVLLLTGNFSEGWKEYEWRIQKPEIKSGQPNLPKPRWTGQDLTGKRIFLHSEQGAGDFIQFCRLCPLLTQRGVQTILGCPPQLFRLAQSLAGVSRLTTLAPAAEEYDYHYYLLSLPLMLGLTLENIPATVPYLHPDPALVAHWKSRLSPLGDRKKIGLVWAGNPRHTNDHNRSIPIELFAPLAGLQNTVFISLQKDDPKRQSPPPGLNLMDYTAELSDYADTAALIENLDLIISADTSVAHLAGALGKQVWTLLPHHPDLRWLLDRSDSPWYPTMRLFRQPRPGDWKTPILAVTETLHQFL